MSEVWLPVGGRNVITVRLESNSVHGRDLAGKPVLHMPLQLQLLPAGQHKEVQYTLTQLTGKLQSQPLGEFASFDVGPLAEVPNPDPFFRQQDALVSLDRQQINRFEEGRAGKDAYFQVMLTGLLWYPEQQKFEVTRSSSGFLEMSVPRSHWIDRVLTPWNLSHVKVIEIKFPRTAAGENFRTSYARLEESERLFASGQYKQVLTTLRISFEGLAKSLGFQAAGKDFFESFFVSAYPEKREKARDALTGIYRFLHLGPHEQTVHVESGDQPVVMRADARLALTLAYAIFEYITPES